MVIIARQHIGAKVWRIADQQEAAIVFPHDPRENTALWAEFEQGRVAKDWLKVERFRRDGPSRTVSGPNMRENV